ncbi:hypothetical protein [uncultured Dokdonia sp.]|uniref:hypothetical protein n=1 Tax=uncultured Dokdonia sp. TaxID=575653 RepID=UPI0026308F29|nr:hypothetical protein [uncultured Dokdonia sp.]
MNSTRTLKSIILALLVLLGVSVSLNYLGFENDEAICISYEDQSYSTLKTNLVGDMVSTYKINQLSIIDSGRSAPDARAITFDLDTIQKFIYDIKRGVEQNTEFPSDEKLGLRIYYAAYPSIDTWGKAGYEELGDLLENSTTRQYEKRHTLVMVPTRINSSKEVVDFNPFDYSTYSLGLPHYVKPLEDENGGVITAVDTTAQGNTKIMAITPSSTNDVVARNHGGLYPPYSDNELSFN